MSADEIAAVVGVVLADFPGKEADPDFLEELAREVHAGRVADLEGYPLSAVAAELRRRALKLRNKG